MYAYKIQYRYPAKLLRLMETTIARSAISDHGSILNIAEYTSSLVVSYLSLQGKLKH
jgi:hypothetical protein